MNPVFRGYEDWKESGFGATPEAVFDAALGGYVFDLAEEYGLAGPEGLDGLEGLNLKKKLKRLHKKVSRKVLRPVGRVVKRYAPMALATFGIGGRLAGQLFGRGFTRTVAGRVVSKGVFRGLLEPQGGFATKGWSSEQHAAAKLQAQAKSITEGLVKFGVQEGQAKELSKTFLEMPAKGAPSGIVGVSMNKVLTKEIPDLTSSKPLVNAPSALTKPVISGGGAALNTLLQQGLNHLLASKLLPGAVGQTTSAVPGDIVVSPVVSGGSEGGSTGAAELPEAPGLTTPPTTKMSTSLVIALGLVVFAVAYYGIGYVWRR